MTLARCFITLGLAAVILSTLSSLAEARRRRPEQEGAIISIERLLLPRAVADRIRGSGIDCRSLAAPGGALYKLHVGVLRLHLTEELSVRGGVGMAKMAPLALAADQGGVSASAGVTYALWHHDRYSIEVDMSALRAHYGGSSMMDATVTFGFRGR
jgi:hypothetical protein